MERPGVGGINEERPGWTDRSGEEEETWDRVWITEMRVRNIEGDGGMLDEESGRSRGGQHHGNHNELFISQ